MRWLMIAVLLLGIVAACGDTTDEPGETDSPESTVAIDATDPTAESDDPTATSEPESTAAIEATPTSEPSPASEATPTVEPTPAVEATATVEPSPTPEPETVGSGRSNPAPLGEMGATGDGEWQARVNEVIRGEDSWQRILEANQFNDPPQEGMEYVMVHFTVTYTGAETEPQSVDRFDFNSTGDARVRWSWPSVVHPNPELNADLFSGGEATGWVVLQARSGEANLIAIFEPLVSLEEGDEIFLALEEGAAVQPLVERSAEENDLGSSRNEPAPLGERVVVGVWEIYVTNVMRGEEAWNMVLEANQYNDPPDEGMEYVAVWAVARNVRAGHGSDSIDRFQFKATGSSNIVHDWPSVVHPKPELDFDVYAGGEVEGWVIIHAQQGETNLSLVFSPRAFGGETRYLSLE